MSDLEKQDIPWGTAAYVSLPKLPMYLRASPDPLQATAPGAHGCWVARTLRRCCPSRGEMGHVTTHPCAVVQFKRINIIK